MNRKRIISICAIIGIVLGVAVFAAQQISDVVLGRISSSNIRIEVMMSEEKEGKEEPLPDETDGGTTIIPGDEVSIIARVKNTGNQEAWVRVRPVIVINDYNVQYKDNAYLTLGNINSDYWKEGDDGYWYYTEKLKPDEISREFFDSIMIKEDIETDFDGANLKVNAEGTQVRNNGSNVFEAEGWPES